MATTVISDYHGRPAIMIDGKPYPPMMVTVSTLDKKTNKKILDEEYYRNLGKSGIKIFFLICDTDWIVKDAFEQFKQEAEVILRAVPDAYLFLRVGMHPPVNWCEENPDETVCYSDGKKKPVLLRTESYEALYPQFTLLLTKVEGRCKQSPLELYDKIEALPYGDRIAGFFAWRNQ